MPLEARVVILLLHLVAMLFMSAPLYMLVIVNERARFAVPPGYNTDRYMENIIKQQPIRCYAYLAVILITGVLLVWSRGWLWADWALIAKLVIFAVLLGLLSYVHLGIQPRIEQVLAGTNPGEQIPADKRPTLVKWRMLRKRLSATCLFLVLTSLVFGVKVSLAYSWWLSVIFVALAALYAWRAFRKPVSFGWF